MDPRTRLLLLLALGVAAVLVDRPTSLAVLCVLGVAPLLRSPITPAWRWRAAAAAVAVVWSTALSQGLFYADLPRVPLIRFGPVAVYREGLLHGLTQSLRFVAVTSAGIAVAVSTPPDRLFAALVRLRVPFSVAFLAVTALRFVPVIGQEVLVVRSARARRGRRAAARNPWAWLVLELAMLRPVLARSIRRAHTLAEALDTRGFDPGAPRAVARPLVMAPWEASLLIAVAGALVAMISVEALYWLYGAEVLYVPWLRPLYGAVRAWL